MKKMLIFFLFSLFFSPLFAQNPDEAAIDLAMVEQVKAWNEGSLEKFMLPYWQSEKLRFIGKNGVTHGWKATLERYKKGYPNKNAMGTLSFTILSKEKLSENTYFVVGQWKIGRETSEIQGHFSLIWQKIDKKWLIVVDHSS